jgi:hypothetical protein
MSRKLRLVAILTLLVGGTSAPAAEGPLDLIPADAGAAVAIRNLNDLIKKGDKFIAESGIKNNEVRFSRLFQNGYDFLGIKAGIDDDRAAAILLANPKALGIKTEGLEILQALVVAVPFSDRDTIAADFGFKKGELKPDRLTPVPRPSNFADHFYARGRHVFLGPSDKAVSLVAKGKSLTTELPADRRKAIEGADVVVHFGAAVVPDAWKKLLQGLEYSFEGKYEAHEKKVIGQLRECLEKVRFVTAGVRFDGGLGINLVSVFPKEGADEARRFLTTVRGRPGVASLSGLPTGNVVAAQAIHGHGEENAALAKVIVDMILRDTLQTNQLLTAADRPYVSGVFAQVWKKLDGSRSALYRNGDATKHGLFSLVAILDADDPKKLLTELKELARFADGTRLDLSEATGKGTDVADVQKLIRDLGDDRYAVREAAATKLSLIGEAALPLLDKARASDDAEVARRAGELHDDLARDAAQRRKDLLDKKLPRVHPTFVFVPAAENVEGQAIDAIGIRLPEKDAAAAKQFEQLFGPDWNKVRVAVRGKQVIVLMGSDPDLLRRTLKNLKEGIPGLAAEKSLEEFRRRANPARKVEFHAALQTIMALTDPNEAGAGKAKSGEGLTSFALTVDADRLDLDVWMPSAEVKAMVKKNGF